MNRNKIEVKNTDVKNTRFKRFLGFLKKDWIFLTLGTVLAVAFWAMLGF